jgi:putative cell wall-binding protein
VTGTNRFETSVEVSRLIYPDGSIPAGGVPVVYVANGLNYPDALAAGPAAIQAGGVVLLSYPWELPAAVRTELERLDPQRIVVVGDTPSISAAVFAALGDFVDSPADLDRITGSDRFGTSRQIAEDAFDSPQVAFIATGLNYPDALAAGPPAGLLGAPIILVNGSAGRLDDATVDVLDDLQVSEIYIIGGLPSVSSGIMTHLRQIFGTSHVTRLTGSDRFGTAVAIAIEFFPESDTAFLATGLNFPDALAGGPAAAAYGAPLYLSRQDCIQPLVLGDIVGVGANDLILLGGPPSLSANVENVGVC